MPRRHLPTAVFLAAVVLAAACGRDGAGGGGPGGGNEGAATGPGGGSGAVVTLLPGPRASGPGPGTSACEILGQGDVAGMLGIDVLPVETARAGGGGTCVWRSLDGAYDVVEVEVVSTGDRSAAARACERMLAALDGADAPGEGLWTRAAWAPAPPQAGAPQGARSGRLGACLERGPVLLTVTGPIEGDLLEGYALRLAGRFAELLAEVEAS